MVTLNPKTVREEINSQDLPFSSRYGVFPIAIPASRRDVVDPAPAVINPVFCFDHAAGGILNSIISGRVLSAKRLQAKGR